MERNYVIVCNEHRSWPTGTLLFWGEHTEDDQERSFGGYTTRWDKCEKYTREELERFRGGLKKQYPFFDEIWPGSQRTFKEYNEVLCTMENLESIGYKLWTVVCSA